jgi:branched-chain amino acid transport system substrate-binding protein
MKARVSRRAAVIAVVVLLALAVLGAPVFAGGKAEGAATGGDVLKIGVLGVMSGAAASWGLVMKYSAEAIAKMFNDEGGVLIDGKRYKVEVISFDEKLDPRLAKTSMERLVYQEKIKYIIGTNTDDTTASSQPVLEAGGAVNITYGFAKDLFRAPHYNTILGMPTPYTTAPIIYKYMMDSYKVKTIAFVARNDADALYERTEGMEAAQNIGLKILSSKDTYEPGTTDFFPVMTKVLDGKPDLIELSGASPGDAPQLIKAGVGLQGAVLLRDWPGHQDHQRDRRQVR